MSRKHVRIQNNVMQMALCSTKIKQITYSRTQPGAGTHTDARGEFEEYHGMSDIESAVWYRNNIKQNSSHLRSHQSHMVPY
jgi:hypothetical protein